MKPHLDKIKNPDTWSRILITIACAIILYFGIRFIIGMAFIRTVSGIFISEENNFFKSFSQNVNVFIYQTCGYMLFLHNDKPFPFGHWPESH